ncbi:MAG: OmpA family protein [Nitrospiraceae bacterium]
MAKPVASFTALVTCLSLLVLLAACSGRKLSTSAEDETLVPGAPKKAKVEPPPQPPQEVARAPEPPPPAAPPPPPPKEEVLAPEPPPPLAAVAPGPGPLVLSDVYFDYDQFVLRSDAKAALEGNARRLKAGNGATLLIEGHCDERGTVAYNLVLGERRARMVEQYLKDLGIAPSRLQITSYGKERPFCSVHSDHCWQQNRRAHFVLQ